MLRTLGWPVLTLALLLGGFGEARAQADPQNFLFNTGQTIQPFFEGWAHHPDGGFDMHFGYLNRNYVEELYVPVGQANRVEARNEDQGQPTFFYPRVNHRVFSVTVPADFGDRELVWTVTVNNESYRAVGWLQPEWEINPNPGARFAGGGEGQPANQAPTLVVEATRALALSDTLTMTATVTDDGLPPARERGGGQNVVPAFAPQPDGPTLPVNVPQIQRDARPGPTSVRVERVNVTWRQWRGPTGATVESTGDPAGGVATVTASFEHPGEYIFKVTASDGPETVREEIAITVR